ncbi:methionyl-tRNA formyltransferase [Campylobacter vulpis]|nr:methionyl-tRNA formyltransferase [Campylobacter vulpis]MBS4331360.1 methionyl-tRNA formyltransferase [Campylobacter vulpis]
MGYLGDGKWARFALLKFLNDERLKVAFVILRVKKDMKLQKLAQKFAIPHFVCENINDEKSLRLIESFKPDLLVSMSFDQIFKARILEAFEGKIINCHASKLPFYRGRNNLNWVLINDEKEFGVSVHFVDSGVDTGDLILQKCFAINDKDDYSTLLKRAYKACAFLLYEAVLLFLNPPVRAYSQQGFVCKRRVEGDERIDWTLSTRELFNFIRALNVPNLGASAFIDGVLIKFYKSKMLKQEFKGVVGEIVSVSNEGFVVCTKDGALKITHYKGEVALGSFFDTHGGGGGNSSFKKRALENE